MADNPVSRWINNVFDAGEKLGHASQMTAETKSGKKEIEKKQAEARGQAWGALLQNRSYDEQGKIKGSQPNHHVTDSKNHTKPLTKEESNFVKGQAAKEKIAKKTGVYPNTAN